MRNEDAATDQRTGLVDGTEVTCGETVDKELSHVKLTQAQTNILIFYIFDRQHCIGTIEKIISTSDMCVKSGIR